nr:PIN domain-containing protein [Planosporangium flavigriseum]
MTKGLIVLDTNVLLSAYRFAPQAREELLTVLSRLQERLWIPDQVAYEFHKTRFGVIAEHRAAYDNVLETLGGHREVYERDLENKIRELANRAALSDHERDQLIGLVRNSMEPVRRKIETLRKRHGLGDAISDDPILSLLQSIFSDKVGAAFESAEEEAAARAAADARINAQRPPGFKDASKEDPHGDYLVWSQTLKEAQRRKTEFLVFVTGDTKDDWYLRVKGKTIMARPELAEEVREVVGARLIVMQTKTFLRHAGEHLETKVSPETIRQAEKLPNVERVRAAKRAAARQAVMQATQAEQMARDEADRGLHLLRRTEKELHEADGYAHEIARRVALAKENLTESENDELLRLFEDELKAASMRREELEKDYQILKARASELRLRADHAAMARVHETAVADYLEG